MKLRIKYCGGCNSLINREKLVGEVIAHLQASTCMEITQDKADAALVVCGCPVACVDLDKIKRNTEKLVLVAGNNVNYLPVPAEQTVPYIGRLLAEQKAKKAER